MQVHTILLYLDNLQHLVYFWRFISLWHPSQMISIWGKRSAQTFMTSALGAFGRSDKEPDEYIAYISDEFKKYGFPLKQSTIALMRKRLEVFNKT